MKVLCKWSVLARKIVAKYEGNGNQFHHYETPDISNHQEDKDRTLRAVCNFSRIIRKYSLFKFNQRRLFVIGKFGQLIRKYVQRSIKLKSFKIMTKWRRFADTLLAIERNDE